VDEGAKAGRYYCDASPKEKAREPQSPKPLSSNLILFGCGGSQRSEAQNLISYVMSRCKPSRMNCWGSSPRV
jgi:hypothetical protein